MFLRRLTLSNVRSIRQLDIDFSASSNADKIRQWTLLLAENGTGKSAVLRSIGLLMAGGDALIKMVTNVDGWIRNGAKKATMQAVIETEKGEPRTISLEFVRGMGGSEFIQHNLSRIQPLEAALRHTARNYFIVAYGASRRLPGSVLGVSRTRAAGGESFLPPRAQAMATLFSADAELNSLQNWAMDLDYERGANGLEIIRTSIKSLLPGVVFDRIDKESKTLLFKTPDGVVPLSRLSDGYQNMAGWIGDLLFRVTQVFKDLKKPLTARGVLLLDEMDLHLHPVWQRQLMAFLSDRLPNFQIVATTHSPLTAQQAGTGELHLLERPSPTTAPVLRRFEGTPRQMRIEDLMISPWFGLHTAYSLAVEQARAKHEATNGKTARATKATRGLAVAAASAQVEMPVYEPRSQLERENRELLLKLSAAIVSQGKPARKQRTSTPKKAATRK